MWEIFYHVPNRSLLRNIAAASDGGNAVCDSVSRFDTFAEIENSNALVRSTKWAFFDFSRSQAEASISGSAVGTIVSRFPLAGAVQKNSVAGIRWNKDAGSSADVWLRIQPGQLRRGFSIVALCCDRSNNTATISWSAIFEQSPRTVSLVDARTTNISLPSGDTASITQRRCASDTAHTTSADVP